MATSDPRWASPQYLPPPCPSCQPITMASTSVHPTAAPLLGSRSLTPLAWRTAGASSFLAPRAYSPHSGRILPSSLPSPPVPRNANPTPQCSSQEPRCLALPNPSVHPLLWSPLPSAATNRPGTHPHQTLWSLLNCHPPTGFPDPSGTRAPVALKPLVLAFDTIYN